MITATVTGNVGKQPESRTTKNGKLMTSFSIASTRKQEGREPITTWVDVVCFEEQADAVIQSLNKGDRAVVTGKLDLEKYQKKDGTEGQSLRIIADEVSISLRFPKRERAAAAEGW